MIDRARTMAQRVVEQYRNRVPGDPEQPELVDLITAAILSFSEPEWHFDMEAAPKDGTEIEAICQHPHYPYAAEADRHEWIAVVRAHWIDHNGGGWTWHGLAGRFIAWRPAAPQPDREGGR